MKTSVPPQPPSAPRKPLQPSRFTAGSPQHCLSSLIAYGPTPRFGSFTCASSRYALEADQAELAIEHLRMLQIAKPDDPEIIRLTALANAGAGHADRAGGLASARATTPRRLRPVV